MRLGVIADPHVSLDRVEDAAWHNPYRLADAHERLEVALTHPFVAGADAIAVLGDLCHFGDERSMRFVVDAVTATGKPAVMLSGNHDVLEPGVRLANVDLPELPTFDGFAVELHHVVELARDGRQPFDVESSVVVDHDAAPLLVLTHFPVLAGLEHRCRDAGLLYAAHLGQLAPPPPTVMRAGRPTVVLSGHLHLRGVTVDESVINIVFAALVEPPYEVASVELTADDAGAVTVTYDCASVRQPDAEKLPVLDPPAGAYRWTGERWAASMASRMADGVSG